MQWLNKVDDALDRVFVRPGGPQATGDSNNRNGDQENSSQDQNEKLQDALREARHAAHSSVGKIDDQDTSQSAPSSQFALSPDPQRQSRKNSTLGEFPIHERALVHDIDNRQNLDFDNRQSTTEQKLQNLANMMKQLEQEARESASYSSNENEKHQVTSPATNTASIPWFPRSSSNGGSPMTINLQQTQTSQNVHQSPSRPYSPPISDIQTQHPPNQQWEPSTPRLPQNTTSPLPTPHVTPRSAARPTPGIIRRKIRSPSVSSSNSSPLSSLDGENDVGDVPLPPFIQTVLNVTESPTDATNEKIFNMSTSNASSQPSVQAENLTPIQTIKQVTTQTMLLGESPRSGNLIVDTHESENDNVIGSFDNSGKSLLCNRFGNDMQSENIEEEVQKAPNPGEEICDSSSTTFHSQVSNGSDLTDDENEDNDNIEHQSKDFAVPSSIHDSLSVKTWNDSFNCYGTVHVRVLRAQRLPCAAGALVMANLTLPPWKGRVRIPSRSAFYGPEESGVCLRWDDSLSKQEKGQGSVTGEEVNNPCTYSMVHAYNNTDTPVPNVTLTLSSSTMGGIFEKFLCSVSFSCRDIMMAPGTWRSKWYIATTDPIFLSVDASSPSKRQSSFLSSLRETIFDDEQDDESKPLVLLETCFEPKVEEPQQMMLEEDSDTLGPIPRDLVIRSSPENRLRHMPDTIYSSIEDDSVSKTSSLTSALVKQHSSKSHLLRVRSFWTPAWCAVCSNLLTTGWLRSSFECEACNIFCCKDCQLQVDVSVPCGSELSRISVKKAQQYQVSVGQIMTTLAPYSGTEVPESENKTDTKLTKATSDSMIKIEGVGVLSLRVLNACLFDKPYPSDTEPSDIFKTDTNNLRDGDHYVRITWIGSKDSKRTKTVYQTAKPTFDSDTMVFDVAHYGIEYKLEVVDANTDKPVGSCLLSPQGLLQMQRDNLLARWDQLLLAVLHFRDESEPRRVKLELRSTIKDGFGLNFYNSTKINDDSIERNSTSVLAGEISGWIEFDVNFEEDTSGLFYSSRPRHCPPRGTEEFDIAMVNLHIARIGAIIEDIQKLASTYIYLISWEDPHVTFLALIVFIITTLKFNLEYLGALPVGILVLYMLYLGKIRLSGHFKDRWINKEKNALVESESKIAQNYTIHRPVGIIQVGELRGKNLRSRDLGLPGSFYVSISFDPLRYANENKRKAVANFDASSACIHQIGDTISPGITSSPDWTIIRPSAELNRLKHLLPDDHLWCEKSCLVKFPVLQPITKDKSIYLGDNEDGQKDEGVGLLPWDSSLGALVLQVRFSEVLGAFHLFENVLGEVVLPLSKLTGGQEVEGWFRLLSAGTTDTVPGQCSEEDVIVEQKPRSLDGNEVIVDEYDIAVPELYARVKFSANSDLVGSNTLAIETSKVICEEMVRTASTSREGNIGVMIGSSISTINTVRTLGGTLQNQLSNIVDIIEMVRNVFNFSSPRITCALLICLSLLWLVLAFIPTRIVVLLVGLGQYGATYYKKFLFVPKATKADSLDDDTDAVTTGNIVENLFYSIPTDEDLRRAYFWEARRAGEREREKYAETKRQSRLKKLWKASWHGTVKVKEKRLDASVSQSKRTWHWDTAFLLIEGHRFIWWRSEKHFDLGEAPLGQIFFAGHSGLAGLSPLDLRELSVQEIPFIVSVFGRGDVTQQKLIVLAPNQKVKDELENAVLAASTDSKAD